LQTGAPMPDLSRIQAGVRARSVSDTLLTVGGVADGGYRYRVRTIPLRGHGSVMVIATSLSAVRATVQRVALLDGLVSLVVVLALLVVGFFLMRVGLRPLEELEQAALRIAGGDLTVRVQHDNERTEVGRLGQAFNRMVQQIDEAFGARAAGEDRLRRFVADASHEFRTPLTSIRAYAELLRSGALPTAAAGAAAVSRIEAEAKRMGSLVDDLLTLARLDQHRPLVRRSVDLRRLVRECLVDTAAAATGHRLTLDAAGGERLAVRVPGDEDGLRQVLGNLLRNAVIHTPAGTNVRIQVSVSGPDAVVAVEDDGPGISAEAADHVFERFYRSDPGRSRDTPGTGLGLAIVRSMVEAHGGRVSLRTRHGEGARFEVRLPLAPGDRGPAATSLEPQVAG
jgi:two-component system, OmpR family, sensor kinase